jgi:hypothetical protein
MRDLLFRIWRYLNYPTRIHGKVEEIGQGMQNLSSGMQNLSSGMQNLSDYFPPRAENTWKVDAAMENFRIKIASVENDLRYLKTMVAALGSQLANIQDQLRLSQSWLPSPEGPEQKPENCLLTFLASFTRTPIAVNIEVSDEGFIELLLEGEFEVYAFGSDGTSVRRLQERLRDHAGLHVLKATIASLRTLAEKKEIPADFSVLRLMLADLSAAFVPAKEWLSPDIVEAVYSVAKEGLVEANAQGKSIIREMRGRGYPWTLFIFRIEGVAAVRFAANLASVPDMTSGSVFFFKDYQLFEQAYRWSQAALPRSQHLDKPKT